MLNVAGLNGEFHSIINRIGCDRSLKACIIHGRPYCPSTRSTDYLKKALVDRILKHTGNEHSGDDS